MGQAKLRRNSIVVIKNFDNMVYDFVRKRNAQNKYGGGIFRCNNVHRTNTGEYNQCIANSEAQRTDRIGPATGWLLCYNDFSNHVEIVPHLWNIDFDRDYMFDTTPMHANYKQMAYVWDSDMFGHICDNMHDPDFKHLPGVAYMEFGMLGYKYHNVIDKCPITGRVHQTKLMDSFAITDFNWDYEYVNPY